ncbi:MAG: MlaD family protein [Nitrospirota bacterium]
MKTIRESDERFINLEKKLGLFVLIAIIGIITVFVFIGIQQDIFTAKTKKYFIADSGRDIKEGQSVKLSGFKIGKVKSLELDDIARVKVALSINKKYMRWIKTDSKARLTKEGLIGESIIEIIPGSVQARQFEEDDLIEFEREKEIGKLAEELKNEIMPVLTDIREIIHYINDPHGDVKQTLKNLDVLSKELLITRKNLDTLLNNADKELASAMPKIDSLLETTKQTITTTDNVLKKIDKEMPEIMEKVNKSLENVQKITEDVKKASPQIPSLVEKGSDIADGAKEVVDSIKKIWPISSAIEESSEKTLRLDSNE